MYAICGGMYRACSTWQYLIAADIIETKLNGVRLGYGLEQCFGWNSHARTDSLWRCVKLHAGHAIVASILQKGRGAALYTYRDLREVTFSRMRKCGMSFHEVVIERRFIDVLLRNDKFWRSQPNVLVQRYDKIVADPRTSVVEIARQLGVGLQTAEVTRLVCEYSLNANRNRAAQLAERLLSAGTSLTVDRDAIYSDGPTLIHWNHISGCGCTQWRDLASLEEQRILLDCCGQWLQENGYEL